MLLIVTGFGGLGAEYRANRVFPGYPSDHRVCPVCGCHAGGRVFESRDAARSEADDDGGAHDLGVPADSSASLHGAVIPVFWQARCDSHYDTQQRR
jgi:hypothetical protein